MLKLVLTLSVLLSVFYSYNAQQCRYETQTEYIDFTYSALATYSYVSSDQCCDFCNRNSLCLAWVYDTRNYACRLIRTDTSKRYSCGRISGRKNYAYSTFPTPITYTTIPAPVSTSAAVATTTRTSGCFIDNNANYAGNDIGGSYNVASAEQCCNLCGANPSCFSFAYLVASQYCYLKGVANPTNRETYPGMISGTVVVR